MIEKIKKLLALSKSPNENEARVALLKAQEIMAKHHISERDLDETEEENEIIMLETNISYTSRTNSWVQFFEELWNHSYYVETIGHISEDTIKQYIEHQSKAY